MIRQVAGYMQKTGMLQRGTRWLVGVSGGVDSVVLLDILYRLMKEERLLDGLVVAHLHHQLRGETADGDMAYVEDLARRYGLPFVARRQDVARLARQWGMSIEEAGRECRYRFFAQSAEEHGCSVIAVAHHADDQVETMLMRLLRGSGVKGLAGMKPLRRLGNRWVARPLLPFSKQEILRYASQRQLHYREDESNWSDQYLRNRIRLQLLPLMEKDNPRVRQALFALAQEMRQVEDYLEQEARQHLSILRQDGDVWYFSVDDFLNIPLALQGRVLKLILEYLIPRRAIARVHVDDLLKLIKEAGPSAELHLPDGIRVHKSYHFIFFAKGKKAQPIAIGEHPLSEEMPVALPAIRQQIRVFRTEQPPEKPPGLAWAVFDAEPFPLDKAVVRSRRAGDRMLLPGVKGRKKVKDILIDAKVPKRMRDQLPLVAVEDQVLWIPGVRQSRLYQPGEHTRQYLVVVLEQMHT